MIGIFLLAGKAFARAGGGDSFGGGGDSSGGGGGGGGSYGGSEGGGDFSSGGGEYGGGDALIELLFWLVFEHPLVGVPVIVVVVVGYLYLQSQRIVVDRQVYRIEHPVRPPPTSQGPELQLLVRRDPGFSEVLFLDFARLVYTRAQEERGGDRLHVLEAVLSEAALRALRVRKAATVDKVIVGSARLCAVRVDVVYAELDVAFVANLTEDGVHRYVEERWTFRREAETRSPGPAGVRELRCPRCGSALQVRVDGSCVSCNAPLTNAALLWQVKEIVVDRTRLVEGVELTLGGGVEVGTALPTVLAPDLTVSLRTLGARHPEFDEGQFRRRVGETFLAVQSAWSALRPEDVRALETDAIYTSHRYWMERYRAGGLRNGSADVAVQSVELVRVQMDAYVTAITVRIQASMLDWTEDRTGAVVGGSRTQTRRFSEYWTFVRSAGASLAARPDLQKCPSCGAPLDKLGETGVCGHCDATITTGDYDWVLAAIDQDEVYGARNRSVPG